MHYKKNYRHPDPNIQKYAVFNENPFCSGSINSTRFYFPNDIVVSIICGIHTNDYEMAIMRIGKDGYPKITSHPILDYDDVRDYLKQEDADALVTKAYHFGEVNNGKP